MGESSLGNDGPLVDDTLDDEQKAQFHDVRRALRSILVLVDMFSTAADVVGDEREPLANLVDVYGDVNDASIAYHDAQATGCDVDERQADLAKAYKMALRITTEYVDTGLLRAYVTRLTPLQLFDVDRSTEPVSCGVSPNGGRIRRAFDARSEVHDGAPASVRGYLARGHGVPGSHTAVQVPVRPHPPSRPTHGRRGCWDTPQLPRPGGCGPANGARDWV